MHSELQRLQEISTYDLTQLSEAYPETWTRVRAEVIPVLKSRDLSQIQQLEHSAKTLYGSWHSRVHKSGFNSKVMDSAFPLIVENRMKCLVINKFYETSLRMSVEGEKPLSHKNRWLSNFIFFKNGLERKPVSLPVFRCLWPFVTQKGRLLSLVNEAGVYCFYSQGLVLGLAKLIAGRRSLEVAAGDGTLTRFLSAAGVNIHATDNYSWSHCIQFPKSVEKLDAVSSLHKYKPEVVVCSWPPPDNSFENAILESESVQSYYLITSAHRFAAGNWDSYERQTKFKMECSEDLSGLILPKEANCKLFIFSRIHS